jgi:hypothetical protein
MDLCSLDVLVRSSSFNDCSAADIDYVGISAGSVRRVKLREWRSKRKSRPATQAAFSQGRIVLSGGVKTDRQNLLRR